MSEQKPQVCVETSMGAFTLELEAEKAPQTVANFLAYVDDKFFQGTIFHRVIGGFMIQGGGLTPNLEQKQEGKKPIQNEADNGLQNKIGTIAMARTNDPHSATSQFFINVNDNDFLNHTAKTPMGWGYCVFGKVIDGMDTVDAIRKVATGNKGMHQDVPEETILIEAIKRI